MWRIEYLIGFIALAWVMGFSCNRKTSFHTTSHLEYSPVLQKKAKRKRGLCNDSQFYIPYEDNIQFVPQRDLRVIFHILDSTGGKHNFSHPEAVEYFTELVDICNERYRTNDKLHLPLGNDLPALPIQVQLKITPLTDDPDDTGVYMHYDDELYWVVTKGKDANNYSRKVIKKYQTGGDSTLNIFVLVHHPDSVASKTYKTSGSGIAMGQSLKIYGMKESGKSPESFPGLTMHEIGHILGLAHTWGGRDGCDDTPKHENCWYYTDEGPCKEEVSNNMMDYNAWESALSPCQIGKIHARFHRRGNISRKMCIKNWCKPNPELDDVIIEEPTIWERSYDLQSNIIVKKNQELRIHCRVSLPENGYILLEDNARLILTDGELHNSCGHQWKGILKTKEDNGAEIVLERRSFIDDVARAQIYPQPLNEKL